MAEPKYEPPILYRVAVLNEFRNQKAFVDFKQFGTNKFWSAFWQSWPHRGYDVKDDRICVFLNYEQVCKTTSKDEAALELSILICGCPVETAGFMAAEQYKLYRAVGVDV